MGLLDAIARAGPRADVSWEQVNQDPTSDFWYTDIGAGGPTFAGFPVSADTAMRVSAVFACNSLILETVASLPCIMYRRLDNGGKERAKEHRWYRPIRYQPNAWMTAMDFYSYGQGHLGLRGSIVNEIIEGPRPQLVPLHPATTSIEQLATGRVRVRHRDYRMGQERVLTQDEVLIVRDASTDGINGHSRATLAREAISVAAAGEAMVGGWFRNDATGRLLITKPGNVPDEKKRAEYRKMIQENWAGYRNASKAMVLYGDSKAEELGKHDDSGFIIDPRNFQVADIARFWRVPLFMIGLEEKSTSWGTGIEQQMHGFIRHTIRPWLTRWEQALARDLLSEDEQEEFFFEFLLDDLLRGDTMSTVQALAIEKIHGAISANEWRIIRNRNPRPGGDEYQETPTGAAPNNPTRRFSDPKPAREDDGEDEDQARANAVTIEIFTADAARRLAQAECREVVEKRATKADGGRSWLTWLRRFAGEQKAYAAQVCQPLVTAAGCDLWVAESIGQRVETSLLAALDAGIPDGWADGRADEVTQIIQESLAAGAAVRRAA